MASAIPAVVGGLALTMTAILFVRSPGMPPAPRRLTGYGVYNFRPEHDTTFFFAGAALTLLAVVALVWSWNRRLRRLQDAPPRRRMRFAGPICIATAGTGVWVGLFMRGHRYVLDGADPPLVHAAALVATGAVGLLAAFAWGRGRFAGGWRTAGTADPSPRARLSLLDLLVPALVVALVYVPDARAVAGHVYASELFFSWDFFSMGPAVGFRHGAALPTTMYSPYGVGWPALFALLSPLIPLSYGQMIQVSVLVGCAYFVGVYVLIRLVTGSAGWAAAGTVLALVLQLFSGIPVGMPLWRLPSLTVIRRPFDVWVFVALFAHLRTARPAWAAVAGFLTGLAIVFVTDSGLYLAAVVAAYLVWFVVRTEDRRARSVIALAVASAAATFGGLGYASRWTLFEGAFWRAWLQPVVDGIHGFTALPLAGPAISYVGGWAPDGPTMALFAVVSTMYLASIAWALIKAVHRRDTTVDILVGCLGLYGLLSLAHFLGRSDPHNLPHVLVPFAVILAAAAAAAHRWARQAPRGIRTAAWRAAPWCALAVLLASLPGNAVFQSYPGLFQAAGPSAASEGLCLFETPRDACGLPEKFRPDVEELRSVASEMRRLTAGGNVVALLDYNDAAYHLAAEVPPWAGYSPLLPNLFHRWQLEHTASRLRRERPAFVLIRPLTDNPGYLADVRAHLHDVVRTTHTFVRRVGDFELWHAEPGASPP